MLKVALLIVAITTLWGWLIAFLSSRLRFRWEWLRKMLTWGGGTAAVIATLLYLLVEVGTRPSPQDTIFKNRATYAVEFFEPGIIEPTAQIRLQFPHAVKWKDESAIDIHLDGVRTLVKPARAFLRTGENFTTRTTQTCESAAVSLQAAVAACSDVSDTKEPVFFRWIVRGTYPGIGYATIQLSRELLHATLPATAWTGVVTRDGEPLTLGSRRSNRGWYSRRYDSDSRIAKPQPLSQARQRLSIDGVEYNFASGDITMAVPVRRTSTSVDGWISMVLTILAGALGSGWAWRVLPGYQPKRRSGFRSKPA